MNALLLPIAFCAGIAIALNGRLARGIGGDSLTASLVSFIIGGLSLAVIALLRGGALPSLAQVPAQPPWSLLGGLLGVFGEWSTPLLIASMVTFLGAWSGMLAGRAVHL